MRKKPQRMMTMAGMEAEGITSLELSESKEVVLIGEVGMVMLDIVRVVVRKRGEIDVGKQAAKFQS